jgi:hypothetical protein
MKIDWVQMFFAILVIFIVVSGLLWFFGVNLPTFNKIQRDLQKPVEFEAEFNNNQITLQEIEDSYDGVYPSTLEKHIELMGEDYCRMTCAEKGGYEDGKRVRYSFQEYSFTDEGILVCKAKRIVD